MPVINFKYSSLCTLLGEKVPMDTLVDRMPMIGADMQKTEGDTDEMSVEFFPDRPDLYSVEGIARAMRAFLGLKVGMPCYEVSHSDIDVHVDDSVKEVRPYFLCGAVMGVDIDEDLLKGIMEMQEKLHITIGRKRSKLAIGVHDLDKVEPPFTYRLADPHSVRFVPLAKDEEMDMEEILSKHEKGVGYAHLLKGFDRYPVIQDRQGRVLSFPPIINGMLTAVTTGTRNLFIDVTGNDRKAVKGALDIVCTALAERGGRIMDVVMHQGGEEFRSPDLSESAVDISSSECSRFLGLDLTPEQTAGCLERMGMGARADGDTVHVSVPAYRLDVMHEVDIFEDVGIGYGFDNIGKEYTLTQTAGSLDAVSAFSEKVRDLMVGLGFMEVTTLTLSNDRDEFEIPRLPRIDNVRVLNPIIEDHTCLRSYLMPSLVKILRHNKHRDLPQRIFEVGNVVRDCKVDPRLCAMVTASKTTFTEIKSIAESVLREMGCRFELRPSDLETFIGGRGAEALVDGSPVGMFGEMSPAVVVDYEMTHPIAFVEIDLGPMISASKGTLF